jgi:transposase-like protein
MDCDRCNSRIAPLSTAVPVTIGEGRHRVIRFICAACSRRFTDWWYSPRVKVTR